MAKKPVKKTTNKKVAKKKYSTSKRAVAARKRRALAAASQEHTRQAGIDTNEAAAKDPNTNLGGIHPIETQLVGTQALLKGRQATHGDFRHSAFTSQFLKGGIRAGNGMSLTLLTDTQREALDMIVHKIGRIIAGNPDEADHWDDIAGYATLVANQIKTGTPVL